jgi:hypothetical protein
MILTRLLNSEGSQASHLDDPSTARPIPAQEPVMKTTFPGCLSTGLT